LEKSTSQKEKVTAVVLAGFSLIYLYGCLRLKLGTLKNPGPGFIPLLVGSLLFLCTSVNLYKVFKRKIRTEVKTEKGEGEGKNYIAIYGILGAAILYPVMLGNLKFILATMIVMFLMLALLKFKNLTYSVLTAFLITVISFVIFARFLGVALPSGMIEEFIYSIGG
jgi:hypothetical protein